MLPPATLLLITTALGVMGWLIVQLVKAKDEKSNANGKAIGELSSRVDQILDRVDKSHARLAEALDSLNKTIVDIRITMAKDYVTWDDLRKECFERRKLCRKLDNE